jgi:hypothetical protein
MLLMVVVVAAKMQKQFPKKLALPLKAQKKRKFSFLHFFSGETFK